MIQHLTQALMPDDLPRIAEAENTANNTFTHTLHVCVAAGCLSQRSDQVKQRLEHQIQESGLAHCQVKGVGCMGLCSAGPLVSVSPQRNAVSEGDARRRSCDHRESGS